MNKKHSAVLLCCLCVFFAASAKKVKELIELADLPEKKIISAKPCKQASSTVAQHIQHKEKKASDYFNVPVTKKDSEPKKILAQKTSSIIPVTYVNEPKKEVQKITRKIPIKNDITENTIIYHYFGARTPSEFSISFNDQQTILLQEKQLHMPQTFLHLEECDEITYTFNYKFSIAGYVRQGGKKGRYRIPSNLAHIQTKFDWNKPHKVIIEGAELIAFHDL